MKTFNNISESILSNFNLDILENESKELPKGLSVLAAPDPAPLSPSQVLSGIEDKFEHFSFTVSQVDGIISIILANMERHGEKTQKHSMCFVLSTPSISGFRGAIKFSRDKEISLTKVDKMYPEPDGYTLAFKTSW